MAITTRFATTQAEREAIFHLRYVIYIEELHLEEIADHEQKLVSHPDDASAYQLYASEND